MPVNDDINGPMQNCKDIAQYAKNLNMPKHESYQTAGTYFFAIACRWSLNEWLFKAVNEGT